jgi:hypothetical protein
MLPALSRNDDEVPASIASAPVLPIEGNLVAAVRALEAAKQQCEQGLLLLQWTPRDEAAMFAVLGPLQNNVANALNAYSGYQEILQCKGQA